MLNRVLQGFLENTEETNGDLFRQFFWDVFRVKVNLYSLPGGQIPAEIFGGSSDADVLELRRMEPVQYRLDVGAYLTHTLPFFMEFAPDLNGRIGKSLFQPL